jgi:hypothetical protein
MIPAHERSFAAPKTFTDEHIERWAAVYLALENNARLRARHVRFETFLLCPREILAAIDKPVVFTYCGLLPKQREAQKHADLITALHELADAAVLQMKSESHCADGAWTEKTRHHAYPRNRRRTPAKEAI